MLGEYKVKNSLGNTDNIYLIETLDPFYNDKSAMTDTSNPKDTHKISETYGEVELATVAKQGDWRHKDGINEIRRGDGVYMVTSDFCKIFDIKVKEGNLEKTLNSPSEIAVTNSYMQYIYGKNAVIGDKITASSEGNNWVNGVQVPPTVYDKTITTIIDEQTKTPLAFGALTLMPMSEIASMSSVYFNNYYSFIKLRKNESIEKLADKIAADTLNFYDEKELTFTPFHKVYFDDSQRRDTYNGKSFIMRRDPSLLVIGLSIAIAILIIAMFNYVNITMTRARIRLRNIAGQRIFGASKWNVRWQTLLDTSLLVTISFLISLIIIYYITNSFNNFLDCKIAITDLLLPYNALSIAGVLLLLILGSTIYILVKIDISSPMEILKNHVGDKISISNILVISQFVISITLIVISLNIYRQINFISTQRPFANSILQISSNNVNDPKLPKDFTDAVKSLAIVDDFSANGPLPGSSISVNGVSVNGIEAKKSTLDFYGIELLEGRYFEQTDNRNNVIINEATIPVFEIEKPVLGKQIHFNNDTLTIIGVVKDFIYEDAHKAIQPVIIRNDNSDDNTTSYWRLFLKVNTNSDDAHDKINATWKNIYPNSAGITIKTVAQIYKEMHPSEVRLMNIVNIFMYISIVLTALGLFGLSFYTVKKRAKEIAIRKIHGSSTQNVIVMLCKTFAVWIAIAIVVATPIAAYLSIEWLSTFTYRVPLALWVFAATIAIATLITFFTVIFQTWRAASANPVEMRLNE